MVEGEVFKVSLLVVTERACKVITPNYNCVSGLKKGIIE